MVVFPSIMWRLLTVYLRGNYICNELKNELKKSLRRIKCLEMLRAMSVTKSYKIDVSCGKLWKSLMGIPWHNFILKITIAKFQKILMFS